MTKVTKHIFLFWKLHFFVSSFEPYLKIVFEKRKQKQIYQTHFLLSFSKKLKTNTKNQKQNNYQTNPKLTFI